MTTPAKANNTPEQDTINALATDLRKQNNDWTWDEIFKMARELYKMGWRKSND